MTRFATFAEKWSHPDHPPLRVEPGALDAAAAALGWNIPAAYRESIISVGLPRPTLALLHSIVENKLSMPDIGEFLAPSEIISCTNLYRAGGLPEHLIAFASDSVGNLFLFERDGGDEGAVYFFDHDLVETDVLAESFDEWIGRYCGMQYRDLKR
jgi:hypothetical protein